MRTASGVFLSALLATTALSAAPARAQSEQSAPDQPRTDSPGNNGGDDIIVTAQKREENVQDVPISIQALGTRKLDQLNITNFNEFTQLLPSVSFQTIQPGSTTVYMRGVASGGDGNHSGSLPSVGFYLDEQPITTIGGTLDVHIYDIARIESLSGPQGTLYGASSEAGTIRIITNKPDTSSLYGRIDGEVNQVHSGGIGWKTEGMLNVPLGDTVAARVVGFYQRDAGYIDNVPGRRDFIAPASQDDGGGEEESLNAKLLAGVNGGRTAATVVRADGGISATNNEFVKKDYNDTETWGGRAALKIDLDDSWTVTPTALYQESRAHGSYGYDPRVGDLEVQRFFPEFRRDRFVQAALTIEGKIGDWDATYAGAYLDRKVFTASDYTDYAEAYDSLYSSVGGIANYFFYQDAAGQTIDPRQYVIGTDHFKKTSQEFRVSSPADQRFRITAGLFYQRQSNNIHQDYQIAGLAPLLSVNGSPGTLWLTQQHRIDKDYAAFGEASFDILPNLTLTAGGRAFIYDNSLVGFFGFGRNPAFNQASDDNPPPNAAYSTRTGVGGCYTVEGLRLRDAQLAGRTSALAPNVTDGSPCTNLGVFNYRTGTVDPVKQDGQGVTYRFNLTWKPTDDLLFYGTVSRGFRPGGINRRADVANYDADFLQNYELGAKSTWLDGHLRVNAAIYQQNWDKFQFSFLGANSFTEIHNGPDARIRGVEADATLNTGPLTLTAAGAYNDAKTKRNLCLFDEPTFTCTGVGPDGRDNIVSAPSGTRLPITPRFKINGTARYTLPIGAAKAYVQGLVTHQSSAASDIRTAVYETFTNNIINPAALLGRIEAYTSGNLSVGADFTRFTLELFAQNITDERGQISRYQACGSCGQRPYIVTIPPRTIGVRAGAKF